MKRLYVSVMLAVLSIGIVSAAPVSVGGTETEGKSLVRIDGRPITHEELDTFFKAFFYRQEVRERVARLPEYQQEAVLARGRSKALTELIHRRLLLDAAEEQFLKNERTSALVEKLTEKRAEEMKKKAGSHVAFVQDLHARGLSLRRWRRFLRETILIQNYMWEKTKVNTRVRPVEMRRYYREHKDQFRRARQIVYRMIIVDPDKCKGTGTEEALAEQIHRQLSRGADFAQLAETYSLDRDRTEGGLRRVEAPEDDPDWVPSICRGLEPGEVSEVQETAAGCCIARLEDIIPASAPPFEEVQEDIHQRLLSNRRRQAQEKLLKELREQAHVKVLPAGREMLGS